jgi:ATP-dependent helicase/nuclease subunit B
MLQLLLGRAGAGKSSEIFRQIAENGGVRPQLLLVPEQGVS